MDIASNEVLLSLTVDIVAAHLRRSVVAAGDLPALIRQVHGSLAGLGDGPALPPETAGPAVLVRKSVSRNHLFCLNCGKRVKTLKKHLMTAHRLTPADYRTRWNLAKDYPMVAREYAERRGAMARKIGLGQKGGRGKKA